MSSKAISLLLQSLFSERGIYLAKNNQQNHGSKKLFTDKKGVEAVRNQLNESYQSGVVEQLHNNKGIYTFNNQKN